MITIFIQGADMEKIPVILDINDSINELKWHIYKLNGQDNIKTFFNKSYRDSSTFNITPDEEIDKYTLSYYNIVEGDIVRINAKNAVINDMACASAFNVGGLVMGRIGNGSDLGKRGEDVGDGIF